MNTDTRELVAIAARLGFRLDKHLGSGHLSLVHTSGRKVTIPATASDWRSRKNAVAELERVSGQQLPRANHRRSRKKVGGTGFNPSQAALESARWHAQHDRNTDELWERRARLIAECQDLTKDRGLLRYIPQRLAVIAQLEQRLERLGEPVTRFDPHSLA